MIGNMCLPTGYIVNGVYYNNRDKVCEPATWDLVYSEDLPEEQEAKTTSAPEVRPAPAVKKESRHWLSKLLWGSKSSPVTATGCGYGAEELLNEGRHMDAGIEDAADGDAGEPDADIPDADIPDADTDTDTLACTTPPGAFSLTSPSDGSSDISITPSFDWADSTDLDVGDVVEYRLEVDTSNTFPSPTTFTGLTNSEYTLLAAEQLNNDTTYYWRVIAVDDCFNETPSTEVFSFTTEEACVPYSFTDTLFTAGTPDSNIIVDSGSIMLDEDYSVWTHQYEATGLPTASGYTENGSPNPSVAGGILSVSTLGSDGQGYYEITTTFNNATGSVVETRLAMTGEDNASTPSNSGFTLWAADGTRQLAFTFYHSGQVCEPLNSASCVSTTTTGYHVYRLEFQGNDYMLYKDGSLLMSGTGMSLSGTSNNLVRFGDTAAAPDASADIDYVYYYNLGNKIPFVTPGTYVSAEEDTGTTDFNWNGATLDWNPSTSAGQVSIAARAANTVSALSSASWSSEMTANPATLTGSLTGRYFQWRITLNAVPLTTNTIVDDVNGAKTCP